MGKDRWKMQDECAYYDYRLIKRMIRLMRSFRLLYETDSSNDAALLRLRRVMLEGALKRNLGGVENYRLYSHTHHGTKEVIDNYVHEGLYRML
jgi:hypothetical protein